MPKQTRCIRSGLVFGKFMPLHTGHVELIRFAQASCTFLTVIVCSRRTDPIPGTVRHEWMRSQFPGANVVHLEEKGEDERPYWTAWARGIRERCPEETFNALFASEEYGWKVAGALGIEYVPFDPLRTIVPISATAIRSDPMRHWRYLPQIVRPAFVRRIALVGPESTGKTVLSTRLARHFRTVRVPEYVRTLLAARASRDGTRAIRYGDIATIGRAQAAMEDAAAFRATKLLFADTELLTTLFWSRALFGRAPVWLQREAYARRYALHLLLAPDGEWVADGVRTMPDARERRKAYAWWKEILDRKGARYVEIRGGWDRRYTDAVRAVEALLTPPACPAPPPLL